MGLNNRKRRAAKAKTKARNTSRTRSREQEREFDPAADSARFQAGAAVLALRQLVLRLVDGPAQPSDVESFVQHTDERQQLAVDDQLGSAIQALTTHGWTPLDLYELGTRKVGVPLVAHLLGVVAAETARHPAERTDPAWLEQVAGIAPAPASADWARGQGLSWPEAREEFISLLAVLFALPKIEPVLSPPGAWQPAAAGPAAGVDERVLRRVRALLAKAEASEFDAEADALTAKAQDLMTRYSIERVLADTGAPGRPVPTPTVRRLWLTAPYVDAKAMLVNAVASSNRTRCVLTKACGFLTLVGFASDLDTVELLSTSLLLQATRAMRASGPHIVRSGTSRTRSFRQSFLIAYAGRIGERLRQTATETEQELDHERSGALLPVLHSREDEVGDFASRMFPDLVQREVRVSNAAGYGAGRAAADLARLDIRDAIAGA